jgi:MFS family permease
MLKGTPLANSRIETAQAVAPPHAPIPRILCAAMALQFAAGGAVIPFITLLLRDRGLDFAHVSQIFLASSASLLVFPFLWGMLADRWVPLNRLFTALNLLAALALVGLAAQGSFAGSLAAFTIFVACLSPMLMLINALGFHHLPNPGMQFGWLRAWGSMGWIVPFLPISLLAWRDGDLHFTLWLGAALCLAMAIFSFWLPHTPPGGGRNILGKPSRDAYRSAIKGLLGNPNYLVLLAAMFLVAGGYSLLTYYSPPLLEEVGVPRPWIGPIQGIGVVSEIILLPCQAWLIRRWNYTTIILSGCLALFARHVLFALSASPWVLSLSYPLAGMVIVFFHMGASVLVNVMAAREVRATAQTLLVFFGSGLGPMFANWAAGRIAGHFQNQLRPVFLFASVLAACAALLILLRGRQLNHGSRARNTAIPEVDAAENAEYLH